jgi:hypothetical protein
MNSSRRRPGEGGLPVNRAAGLWAESLQTCFPPRSATKSNATASRRWLQQAVCFVYNRLLSMGISRHSRIVRSCIFAVLLAGPALSNSVSTTVTFSNASESEVPSPISGPPFAGYAFLNPAATGTFYVGTTGSYNVAFSSAPAANILYLLTGTFAFGNPPATPLANFFAATPTSAFTNITLQAGVQYSFAAIFSNLNGSATFTLTGPGCISFGANNCAAVPVPTLGPGAFAGLSILIALSGMFLLTRGRRV